MRERSEISDADKWDVEAIFKNWKEWEEQLSQLTPLRAQLASYQGRIVEGAELLAKILNVFFNLEREAARLYTYAHLRHDEDVTRPCSKERYDRISLIYQDLSTETVWIEPDILQLESATLRSYLEDPSLADYQVYLQRLLKRKPHTLSKGGERLLSLSAKPLSAASNAFTLFNNADLQLGSVKDGEGKEWELTHGSYSLFLQSPDRTLRRAAALTLHQRYGAFENTLTELLNGRVQQQLYEAKARHYPSALHAALAPHQIDVEIYHRLISTVKENLPLLHRYLRIRKHHLGYETLHFYDLYVSLFEQSKERYSYDEAVALTLEAVAPLGSDYCALLTKGLQEERWVDRYENARKCSGAYSSGSYDTHPYILLNFQGDLRDVMTLAHEAGHSMHSYYSNKNQPFHYAEYPIFLAEIASTFNEELLFHHLFRRAKSPNERATLLLRRIEDLRATLFRQTLFAEFELYLYELAEQSLPLTPTRLKEKYRALNQAYYGSALFFDPQLELEYLRIPHFYTPFYVYQYATGICASHALVEQVMEGGEEERASYLHLLSSGCSRDPLQLLRATYVNMYHRQTYQKLLDHFSELVDRFEEALFSC